MSNNQSSQISFEKVTDAANVAIDPDGFGRANSYGAAWTDFNGDSFPDFWINNHNVSPSSLRNLYLNDGDGTFTDRFSEVFSQEITGDPHGAAWADFDNDGDQDLYQISAGEGTGEGGGTALPGEGTPNWMFVNDEGVLRDRAEELGLRYVSAVAQTPVWLDFDKDGLLDVFHTAITRPDGLYPTTVFRQTEQGFEDVGSTMLPAEVQSTSYNYGVLSDLTGDGSLEIILPQQDSSATAAIILDTSTTPFTDLTATLLPDPKLPKLFDWFTNDIAAADFNNDLRSDLYLARSTEDKLLVNTDQGLVDQSNQSGINSVSNQGAFSVVAGDFDNDMDVDAYTITRKESENRLYENQGDGSFVAVPNAGGAPSTAVRNGDTVTTADYDMDGFLDLFIDSGNEAGYHQLFNNQGNDNNWLEIDLEGVETNRDGIGAQVFLTAGDITQMREQTGGVHKWAQNHQRIHFGLADNTQVDLLEIRWPSGIVQQLENIEANQLLQIAEDDSSSNTINGTDGNDNLNGTDSDDWISGLAGDDTIRSGPGSDTVKGGQGNDFIVSYDWQFKDNDNDVIEGNAGNDRIRGGFGNDTITGGIGNDTIVGGWGNDLITGGEGSDRFHFEVLGQGGDTITDFAPTADTFEFKAKWFDKELEFGVLSTEQFVLGTAAGDKNDRFIYDQSSGNLFYDKDGSDGTNKTLLATLTNGAAVSAEHIVIV